MKRWDVVKKKNRWVTETKGGKLKVRARVKPEAVKKTARLAKRNSQAVSVRIHNRDGTIAEERTYPRREDPSSKCGWPNLSPAGIVAPGVSAVARWHSHSPVSKARR